MSASIAQLVSLARPVPLVLGDQPTLTCLRRRCRTRRARRALLHRLASDRRAWAWAAVVTVAEHEPTRAPRNQAGARAACSPVVPLPMHIVIRASRYRKIA